MLVTWLIKLRSFFFSFKVRYCGYKTLLLDPNLSNEDEISDYKGSEYYNYCHAELTPYSFVDTN
jgi:hypothetical protein